MGILDSYKDLINASFSKWIKVEDKVSRFTIERFSYDFGVDENETGNHCWKCVTVNKCWFKNEKLKKPEKMDYSLFPTSKLLNIIRGLYHPKCHCKEYAINNPKMQDITIIIPEGKIDWVYRDKSGLVEAWGYSINDRELLTENIINASKKTYAEGNYEIFEHTRMGVNISLFIEIPGIKNKLGRTYKRVSSYMIFPNGKLKNNTPIARKW